MELSKKIISQRTRMWYKSRAGKFTASNFGKLMTMPRNKNDFWSKTSLNYIEKTAMEEYFDDYYIRPDNKYTAWGTDHEAEALDAFCRATGFHQEDTGFLIHPEIAEIGATPDAKIIENSARNEIVIAQVKCPYNSANHLKYLNRINNAESLKQVKKDYYWQMQGEMWVSGANYAYFISYDPRQSSNTSLHYVIIHRNENDIETMHQQIINAFELKKEMINEMKQGQRKPKSLDSFW